MSQSTIKTMTFAVVHFSVAFTVAYLLTGSIAIGGAVALVEPMVNTLAYNLHERVWAALQSMGDETSAWELVPVPAV